MTLPPEKLAVLEANEAKQTESLCTELAMHPNDVLQLTLNLRHIRKTSLTFSESR